jgi:hypothetical protein
MSVEARGVGPAASAQTDVHARIERWAIVRLREPGKAATLHIVGYIIEHARLGDDIGQPYLGSSLREIDLERRVGVNRRGRTIALVGDPVAAGDLPLDLQAVLRRAEDDWRLDGNSQWERVATTSAPAADS